ncbi:MAG: gamma-glutamyltransferase family protein [Coprothermobacterota bacterium]|nr:gamma-glutamyltransferase family protein [Coprothermobacterota bacterium]
MFKDESYRRPIVMGWHGMVTSGHYAATLAGLRILQGGGNAVDAAASVSFCLNVLQPHQNSLGGEVPVLVHEAKTGMVWAISGQGWAPKALSTAWCLTHGIDLIPGDGFLPACVPAMVGTWGLALARLGSLGLAEALAPAIRLAEEGFPLYPSLQQALSLHAARYRTVYPSTAAIYLKDGEVPPLGWPVRNPDLAATLRMIAEADLTARGGGRVAGIEAGVNAFYRGPIAERLVSWPRDHPVLDASGQEHPGLLAIEDLAEWQATLEEPLRQEFRGLEVHKCPTWTQGLVFLQQLTLLDGFPLEEMGPRSPAYWHTWVECAKLAFADREAHYGDPQLDRVPVEELLSPHYASSRRALVGEKAALVLQPGLIACLAESLLLEDVREDNRLSQEAFRSGGQVRGEAFSPGDTTHLDVADEAGNLVAATPSGGWIHTSPVIPGLGFPLGTRAQMFYLNPGRANCLAPHKRPRATLTPTLVMKEGRPLLAFGTVGGDGQDQWTVQFFLNHVVFGQDLQAALDGWHCQSLAFPSSFYPREMTPGLVQVDPRLPVSVREDLLARGHRLEEGVYPGLNMMAIRLEQNRGLLQGAVNSLGDIAWAAGW